MTAPFVSSRSHSGGDDPGVGGRAQAVGVRAPGGPERDRARGDAGAVPTVEVASTEVAARGHVRGHGAAEAAVLHDGGVVAGGGRVEGGAVVAGEGGEGAGGEGLRVRAGAVILVAGVQRGDDLGGLVGRGGADDADRGEGDAVQGEDLTHADPGLAPARAELAPATRMTAPARTRSPSPPAPS